LIFSAALKAQTTLPASLIDYRQSQSFIKGPHNSTTNKKWFLTTHSGLSTGFSFFNGGNATFISVPVGLQLNRKLNGNLYAFAGVSAAPAYINFNYSFLNSNLNKGFQNFGSFSSRDFNIYSRAELGLMYINDEKTFSVSGSIGVERNRYPVMPYYPINRTQSNRIITPVNK
jgi:hypothetical protein